MMVAELDDKDSKSDQFQIKLLESFSLPKQTLNGLISTPETEIKSKLKINYLSSELDTHFRPTNTDEHCDHTYSIISSPSYRQNHEHVASTNLASSPHSQNPSIVQTGELTMKIVNSIPTSVPNERGKKSNVGKASKDTSMILATFNNYKHTRSKANSVVHVIQPIEFCVNCRQDLIGSIKSSVFCLQTGNVLITCQNCSIKMSLKGAFKLPKYL